MLDIVGGSVNLAGKQTAVDPHAASCMAAVPARCHVYNLLGNIYIRRIKVGEIFPGNTTGSSTSQRSIKPRRA